MKWLNAVIVIYGILLIALGVYGFTATHSVISIIAGGISGLLEIVSVAVYPKIPRASRIAAAVIALILVFAMAGKAFTQHTWHTVTITITSALMVILLLGTHFAVTSAK